MSIDSVREFIKEKAQEFGAKTENEFNKLLQDPEPDVGVHERVAHAGAARQQGAVRFIAPVRARRQAVRRGRRRRRSVQRAGLPHGSG